MLHVPYPPFRNAIIQTLFGLEEFNLALEKEWQNKKALKGVSGAYLKLVKSFRNSSERDILSPYELKYTVGSKHDRFQDSSQQDAQEFLTAFLENINEESTRVITKAQYKELSGDLTKQNVKQMVL